MPEPQFSATTFVLVHGDEVDEAAETVAFTLPDNGEEYGALSGTRLELGREQWTLLGSPSTVTLTVVPDDMLNAGSVTHDHGGEVAEHTHDADGVTWGGDVDAHSHDDEA